MNFQHLSTKQGLPSNDVWAVYEDLKGNLWIGTPAGLAWYDGKQVKSFTTNKGEISGLDNNAVRSINQSSDGSIWVLTRSGVNILSSGSNTFSHLPKLKQTPQPMNSFYELDNGDIWLIGEKNIFKVNGNTRLTDQTLDLEEFGRIRNAFISNEQFYLVSTQGIYRWNDPTSNFIQIGLLPQHHKKDLIFTSKVVNETVYITGFHQNNLFQFDITNQSLKKLAISASTKTTFSKPNRLLIDEQNQGWLAAMSGLYYVQKEGNELKLQEIDVAVNGESALAIFDVVISHSGDIIIAAQNGVYISSKDHLNIKKLMPSSVPVKPGAMDAAIDKNGFVWLAVWGKGAVKIDADNNVVDILSTKNRPLNMPSDNVSSLMIDDNNILWIGTDKGVAAFSIADNTFKKPLYVAVNQNCESVTTLDIEHLVNIPEKKLVGFSSSSFGFISKEKINIDVSSIPCKEYTMSYIEGNTAYLVAGGQIDILDKNFVIQKSLTSQDEFQGSILIGVSSMNSGNLFVLGSSLFRLNKYNLNVTEVHPEIFANSFSILHVRKGDTHYFGTYDGFIRANFDTQDFRKYGLLDGFDNIEFISNSALLLPDNRMIVANEEGFIIFEPSKLPDFEHNSIPSLSYFTTKTKHDDNPTIIVGLSGTNDLKNTILSHDVTSIEIGLSATNQLYKSDYKFEYKLIDAKEGEHSVWVAASSNTNTIILPKLPAGNYELQVRFHSPSGLVSPAKSLVNIKIKSSPWFMWYAMVGYGLAIILLAYLMAIWRSRNINRKNKQLNKLVTLKTAELQQQALTIETQAQGLKDSLRSKEQLFANVSHEFRTPLTLIKGNAEQWLKTSKSHNTNYHNYIQISINRLINLVDQLLQLSKSQSSEQESTTLFLAKPDAIVESIFHSFLAVAQNKNIKLSLQSDDVSQVLMQSDSIERIVTNIISNAIKYTTDNGRISVISEEKDQYWQFIVKDNGLGLTTSQVNDVFTRYARFHQFSDKTINSSGIGLGLPLVKALVEKHGGTIDIDSAKDVGTTIQIRIPNAVNRAAYLSKNLSEFQMYWYQGVSDTTNIATQLLSIKNEDEEREHNTTSTDQQFSILIVEDDPSLNSFLVSLLTPYYKIYSAFNGEQAWATLPNVIPDLVITDLMMPEVDGFELLKRIRKHELTSHIPVILLSAIADKKTKLQGFKLNADDFITKPFDQELLLSKIENFIALRELRQQLFRSEQNNIKELLAPEPEVNLNEEQVSYRDQQFLNKLDLVLTENIEKSGITVTDIAAKLYLSESQVRRKVNALTGVSPTLLLREKRLKVAIELLKQHKPIKQVAVECGFAHQSHFGRYFKAYYGMTPKEWQNNLQHY